ncbi:unnamed protein product [Echinostoma caproni]|uniref:Centrosomal protein of 78 kDa-like n=1 Tax=Echinostoma caproni TaxID=27848 RepID=A0A183A5K8_9TREM|nr:unnamed protein product [Echinostoma caproni]
MLEPEVMSAVRSQISESRTPMTLDAGHRSAVWSEQDVEERGFTGLTDGDVRRLLLESAGCDLSEFDQLCPRESPTLMASSWMDTKLDTMRTRSRLWDSPFEKSIPCIQSAPDDIDLDNFDLDEEKFYLEDEEQSDEEDRKDGRTENNAKRAQESESQLKQESHQSERYTSNSIPTETELRHDTVGIAQYLHACEQSGEPPIPAIIRQLPKDTIDLSHRGLGPQEVKLFSTGLQRNITVTQLNLSSNQLGVDGAKALAFALKENAFLKTLVSFFYTGALKRTLTRFLYFYNQKVQISDI